MKQKINLAILESHLNKFPNFKQFLQIHAQMTLTGFINDTFAASRLMHFSTNSSHLNLNYSIRILDHIDSPNGFIWNSLLRAFIHRNKPESCLLLYRRMRLNDSFPDNYTYPLVVQACSLCKNAIEGKMIHTHVIKFNFDTDIYVVNTLINMYSVCGNLVDARTIFDKSSVKDLVTWNSMLTGYVQAGDFDSSVDLFGKMEEKDIIASNSMIALFGKTGHVDNARTLFDNMNRKDVVSWTAMISCYEQNEKYIEALNMFVEMHRKEIKMDEVMMISVLSACTQNFSIGASVHGLMIKIGLESRVNLNNALIHMYMNFVNVDMARSLFYLAQAGNYADQISWNSMMAGYMKCGFVQEAKHLFHTMPKRDSVSWSTMISGYCKNDEFSESLSLFHKMQVGDIVPDEMTLVCVIQACAHLFALEQGKWIHAYIKKNKFRLNLFIGTSLVDMYMKLGCVSTALDVFDAVEENGTSTWNACILGLAMNGLVKEAIEKFSDMEKCGILPNEITFVGLLGACRHVGLVDEGRCYFDKMTHEYSIVPNIKHYGCMIDLLGRAGFLKEAYELIESMPMAPDVATWGALLGACKKYNDYEMGESIGTKLIELEPDHDGFHVLLSNIYSTKGKWDDARKVRSKLKGQGVMKMPGCSMIEYNGIVHEFFASSNSHPRMKEIDIMLEEIATRLKAEGYEPDTSDVAYDIEEEEKESSVYRHSERVAIAFGLMTSSASATIRIAKNIRICADCHAVAKIISRSFQRVIVVRDRLRFHHFKDGVCSCKEYW